ncbi:hypothetical protein CDL15_Pgr006889 [Punica granatum]|uniref:Uncharacterized protein n=1 Tax=Punica granatum TaxID=22663 RepID=A0A218X7S8_PUNGR|nr:hypothetical protein CDL15_Pgr006889 [Punica granatum]
MVGGLRSEGRGQRSEDGDGDGVKKRKRNANSRSESLSEAQHDVVGLLWEFWQLRSAVQGTGRCSSWGLPH